MKIVNPYQGIDFSNAKRVVGITHEHIYSTARLKAAYNRGVRWFACVNYTPAVPAVPLTQWSGNYKIWNYFDVSSAFPTSGANGTDLYDSESARSLVPNERDLRQSGLVIAYNSTEGIVYEKFEGSVWSVSNGWRRIESTELNNELTLKDATYSNSCQNFVADNGDNVVVAELPSLANAEHTMFKGADGKLSALHFNVLGNLFGEACAIQPQGYPRKFIEEHPIYQLADIEKLFGSDLQFPNKLFGTINHSYDTNLIKKYIAIAPSLFKGMELFNQTATKERNQKFRNAYDALLKEGYRLWAVSVADWIEDIEGTGYAGQDMTNYEKECDFVRGCNVLYMPNNYDSLSQEEKTENGLDAYIKGAFYASGLGNHYITKLEVNGKVVRFSVDGNPSKLKVITSNRVVEYENRNSVSEMIEGGESYIRFEAYYYNDKSDMDFIFTNPIWIEDNEDDKKSKTLLLLL